MLSKPVRLVALLLTLAFYITFFVLCLVLWENYWAAYGNLIAAIFVVFTLGLVLCPNEILYRIFPLGSVTRVLFQALFATGGLALVVIACWLLSRGVRDVQGVGGRTYYLSALAFFIAGRWAFFVTIPIYYLRPDQTDPQFATKLAEDMRVESVIDTRYTFSNLHLEDETLDSRMQ